MNEVRHARSMPNVPPDPTSVVSDYPCCECQSRSSEVIERYPNCPMVGAHRSPASGAPCILCTAAAEPITVRRNALEPGAAQPRLTAAKPAGRPAQNSRAVAVMNQVHSESVGLDARQLARTDIFLREYVHPKKGGQRLAGSLLAVARDGELAHWTTDGDQELGKVQQGI